MLNGIATVYRAQCRHRPADLKGPRFIDISLGGEEGKNGNLEIGDKKVLRANTLARPSRFLNSKP